MSVPQKVVWMVIDRGDRSYWTRIGVGFVNRDKSITLRLDAMPVSGGTIQVRDYVPREDDDTSAVRENREASK